MKTTLYSQGLRCLSFFLLFSFLAIDAQSSMLPFADSTWVEPNKQSLFNTWQEEDILHLELKAPLSTLFAEKKQSKYQAAALTINHKSKTAYQTPVAVKVRGKFRRQVCGFPPLKIKLQDKKVNGITVGNYRTFKLVTHCSNDILSNKYLLKEYLIYQMYQALREESYRTQLVKITYVDEDRKMSKVKRYGFLIEDIDELEDRLEADDCKCGIDPRLNAEATAEFSLFQFMIGNTDWDFSGPRNLKVLVDRQSQKQIAIPYDFDFTGFVNPPYGFPNPDYAAEQLQDRIMMDTAIDAAALQKAIALFKTKKTIWYQMIEEQAALSKADKKDLHHYLDSFFQILEAPLEWEARKIIPYE